MTTHVRTVWRTGAIWLIFVALETAAQLALKMAADTTVARDGIAGWFGALASSPWFQLSIGCDIVNFFAWMAILRQHDLSLAIPLSSAAYVAIIAASTIVLHENIETMQWLGLILIGLGIVLVAADDATSRERSKVTRQES